ncbi:hypothetical protein J3U37_03600 [Gilliamella sp. B3172]|uniref:hypothetical protein n=1 Tax=Gilliamella sp. B3172 TaxID=2818006 RepID=UPI00226A9BEA|nr:hypothetical protein [Gilliamella sp. B3172]MCX8639174.1 hypothetical protein [Gilliamella sp. B3172]
MKIKIAVGNSCQEVSENTHVLAKNTRQPNRTTCLNKTNNGESSLGNQARKLTCC